MSQHDDIPRKPRRLRKRAPLAGIDSLSPPERPARRRKLWPWIVLGLFLLGVYLVPNLASSRSVRGWIVASVSKDLPVKIDVDGATVGWFSPITLYGVHVTDLEGEPLLDADQITCRSALSSLMFNSLAPGVVRVEGAVVQVRISADSSNWEQALAQLPPPQSDEPLDLDAAVEVIDGTIVLEDTLTGRNSVIKQVNGRIDYPQGNRKPLMAKLTATVAGATASNVGKLDLDGQWFLPVNDPQLAADWGSGKMSLTLDQIPVEVASPLLRRAALATAASGELSAKLVASRGDQGGPLRVEFDSLAANSLTIVKPALLSEPQVTMQQMMLAGTFDLAADRVQWHDVTFQADFANLSTAGGVNFASLAQHNYEAAFAGYAQHAEGSLDLAAVARTLPGTLAIRDDVQIQGGRVAFHFDNGLVDHHEHNAAGHTSPSPPSAATKWGGSLEVADIAVATATGQVHRVPPARLSIQTTYTPTGISIDSIEGQGEFFALRGAGNMTQGQLAASISLDKLQAELQHVIDLGGMQLAGLAEVSANWSRGTQDQWSAAANARMTQWRLTLPQRGVWQEPQLTLTASLMGLMSEGKLEQILQGKMEVVAGADILSANLIHGIDLATPTAQWPISYTLQGDASRWQTRLAAAIPMQGIRLDGQINAAGQVALGSQQVAWQNFHLHAEPLIVTTAGMRIEEPVTDFVSSGYYTPAGSALAVQELKLVSTSVSVQGQQIQADFAQAQPIATGQLAFRGDWSRIGRWFAQPTTQSQQPLWRMEGTFEGNAILTAQNEMISGTLSMVNQNTSFYQLESPVAGARLASSNVPQWKLAWQEPEATVSGKLSYRPQAGLMQLENLSVLSNMLQFAMSGNVSDMQGKALADLRGSVQYDLAKLSTLLQTRLGSDVHLTGTKQSEFYIRGPLRSDLKPVAIAWNSAASAPQPLVSPQLEAAGGMAWDSAQLYGLPVGAAAISSKLQQSVLVIDPIEVPISQGRLKIDSKVFLFEPTPTVAIAKGRVVDNVEITPQMCHAWLKYVAPLVADVTRVQGRLALDLNDTQIPLGTPQLTNTSGAVVVSNAQVGPGPLSDAVIFVAQRMQSLISGQPPRAPSAQEVVWVNVPQQQIPFAVREGRVFHENMQMNVGNVYVTTSGSVGFDQSLSMIAEVPIRSEWFQGRQGILSSLQGRKLQIPVTGTITKPQLDSQIFEQLAKQSIQGAANNLINDGIRRGLDRLLGPPPQ